MKPFTPPAIRPQLLRPRLLAALPLFAALCLAGHSTLIKAEEISSAPLLTATLSSLDDQAVSLAQYKGKPLLVNFWARWCGPCRAEIPELIKFRTSYQGKIEVIGIAIENQAAPTKEFAKAYDINYPVYLAKEQGIPLMQALGNRRGALPYSLLIDAQGRVIHQKLGLLRPADLEEAARRLLPNTH